jgi:N-succinyldiaminopimelate aminotransferase
LLDRIVDKVRDFNRIPIEGRSSVVVTTGATGAMYAAAATVLSPGDEVLLLAPYWPLIGGHIRLTGARPVLVPVLHEDIGPAALGEALASRVTERTAAIYVNTPSNPTGRVLSAGHLAAIAEVARTHDLWILADEVYEDYVYEGEHLSIGAMAQERTLTGFSFSKAYGMTGYRAGYLVGPAETLKLAKKRITYVWYSVPTPSQYLALRALDEGAAWKAQARESYRQVGQEAARRLGLPAPQGSTFLFCDVAHKLDDRGLLGFLEDCLDDNLILAPGPSFGDVYDTWIRLCFTAVDPERTLRGVDRLARRLGA